SAGEPHAHEGGCVTEEGWTMSVKDGGRRPGLQEGWRGRAVVAGVPLAIALLLLTPTPALSDNGGPINGKIGVDEVYGIGTGDFTGMIAANYQGGPGGVGFAPVHLTSDSKGLGAVSCSGQFVYITAWSDNNATTPTNGVIADFGPNGHGAGIFGVT